VSHFDSDGALRSVRLARRQREQVTGYAGWRSSRDFLGHVMSLLALCLWLLMGAPAVGIAQGVEASGTPGPGGVVEGPGPRYEQRDDGTAVVSVRVEQQSGVDVRVLGRAVNVDVEGLAVP